MAHVVVVGTGGTIAGSRKLAQGNAYQSAVTGVDTLLADIPELADLANISAIQFAQLDSTEIGLSLMLRLAQQTNDLLSQPDVDAVVITHGTDTLEESAFLLNLVVNSSKPVVFLGSMRPADALSADGPDNLFDAVAVAANPESHGRGVLVVFDDQIHAARDVTKTNTTRTDAFRSPYGPLGEVIDGQPYFVRRTARRQTSTSAFASSPLPTQLPRVEAIITHPEMPLTLLDALADAGTQGIVHIGPGNGNISMPVERKLRELRNQGIMIVRASRVGSGIVTRNGSGNDDERDFIAADDHNPAKSRILLALALTQTQSATEIQQIFREH